MKGRAGGEDVVDDDIARGRVDRSALGDGERAGDVLTTFLSPEPGLRNGLMLLAEQRFGPAPWNQRRQSFGDPLGLVIAAVTSAGDVQRDRHEHRSGQMSAEDFVLHGRRGQVVGEERTTFILDAMDDPAGGSAGTEGADRPTERRPEIEAMRAGAVAFEDAF
ncbi:MAG: hypothetical protein RLZZ552_530, partial [Verrucomicrobiota bacterium]